MTRLMTRATMLALAIGLPCVVAAAALQRTTAASIRGDREYSLKNSAVAADGSVWLVAGVRPKGRLGGPDIIQVHHIGSDSSVKAPIDAAELIPGASGKPVVGTSGNAVMLAAATGERDVTVVTIDPKTHRAMNRKSFTLPGFDAFVANVVALPSGSFLLLGRTGAQAWMLKLDAGLAPAWERVIEDVPATIALDAAAGADGSFAVAGAHATEAGESHVWIASFTKEGVVKKHAATGGLQARIASDGRGGYVVLHDYRDAAWDVWARGFSADLEERWSERVATGSKLAPSFEISEAQQGQWIIATEKERRPWVALGDANGKIVWSHEEPSGSAVWESVWNVGAPAMSGATAVLSYTVLTVDEKREQRQEIRVVRLSRKSE